MSSVPKASALRLASTAHELGADVLRGTLEQNEAGRWMIGHTEIETWLAHCAGQETVLAMVSINQDVPTGQNRTCRTCGREYEGRTCPHCEEVRSRLRR